MCPESRSLQSSEAPLEGARAHEEEETHARGDDRRSEEGRRGAPIGRLRPALAHSRRVIRAQLTVDAEVHETEHALELLLDEDGLLGARERRYQLDEVAFVPPGNGTGLRSRPAETRSVASSACSVGWPRASRSITRPHEVHVAMSRAWSMLASGIAAPQWAQGSTIADIYHAAQVSDTAPHGGDGGPHLTRPGGRRR